ncbi:MAG: oligopeptide ABC transporter substrate-binding protein [Aerococcaceae bacterium]|nr:oligopeptide ABC transporter substrate-binding protein [Aerococcaceae bacterium]
MKRMFRRQVALVATALTLGSVVANTAVSTVGAEGLSFEKTTTTQGEAINGGTFKYGLAGETFAGVLNKMFYDTNVDAKIISLFNEALISYDSDFNYTDKGFGRISFDKEKKQVTITIPEGHKWDDGEPITIDDVIFPYYVIGHKDYTGIRYGEQFTNVVGMDDYHEGKAETISGLDRVDDYTLTITYKTFSNSMLIAGGGVATYIEPEHAFEGIEVADMADSEIVRKKPVGFGPFKVESITPGESVTYVANEYYWRGKPKLDGVVLEVVSETTAPEEMKSGRYDLIDLPADTYPTYKDATNFQILGELQNAYTYVGFKLGKWNEEKKEVEVDDTKVLANVNLRKALAYAVDNNAVGEKFYNGLRIGANTLVTPNFKEWYAEDIEGYTYDEAKAKTLLTEAGFEDKDGDGFVEDPSGKPFTLKFASMSGGETAEPLAQYYVESWKAIGVNVELTDGRLLEFNSFYDRVKADDPEIDIFLGAFSVGGDPTPDGLWGRTAPFNYTRFASEELDTFIDQLTSDESFDLAFKKKAFREWQQYMVDAVPAFPTLYRYALVGVNKRVKNYTIDTNSDLSWADVELTADKPLVE